ncbi:hypothetical protein MSG28_008483, partial [Choristoneura fumiferana]
WQHSCPVLSVLSVTFPLYLQVLSCPLEALAECVSEFQAQPETAGTVPLIFSSVYPQQQTAKMLLCALQLSCHCCYLVQSGKPLVEEDMECLLMQEGDTWGYCPAGKGCGINEFIGYGGLAASLRGLEYTGGNSPKAAIIH